MKTYTEREFVEAWRHYGYVDDGTLEGLTDAEAAPILVRILCAHNIPAGQQEDGFYYVE